ncbi:MAG: hypothetical protein H5U17_00615 [Defluviimonas sp.]|nr:hypothetical protein [Defluviimonas sp.]
MDSTIDHPRLASVTGVGALTTPSAHLCLSPIIEQSGSVRRRVITILFRIG